MSDEWCGWISQNDTKTRWSLTEAADLTKAGKDIAEYADYDVNKGKKPFASLQTRNKLKGSIRYL